MNGFKPRYGALLPVLAIFIPLLLCFSVLEVGLRFFGTRAPIIRAEMFTWQSSEALLPYTLRPDFKGTYAGGLVTIGPDGNRIVPLPLQTDTEYVQREVVIVGDSVVFGQGLDDDQTIAANMQRLLLVRHGARVVSIAAPGYTSWNEYTAVSRYMQRANPNDVVLVYVHNDVTRNNDHFNFKENGGKIYYMERDFLRKVTGFFYERSRLFYIVADSIKRLFKMMRDDDVNYSSKRWIVDRDAMSYSIGALKGIKMLCDQIGATFRVAIYRGGSYYSRGAARDFHESYERLLTASLKEAKIDHFILGRAVAELPLEKFRISWNDDGHPSAIAAQLIAEEIVTMLMD